MSIITSIGVIVLSMLIMASLQLTPGVFALLYHYSLGRFSRPKAANLALFFIIGVEFVTACLFLSIHFLVCIFFFDGVSLEFTLSTWILTGIIIVLGLASPFLYYRPGPGSKLFISRRYAKALDYTTKTIKTQLDSFILGITSGVYELILTLPLFIASSIAIVNLNIASPFGNPFSLLFVLSPILPLFIIYWRYQTRHNLADIAKSRTSSKPFIRFLLISSYLLIATLIICSRII